MPLIDVEEVILSQSEIINRIQRTAGMTKEDYASLIQPIIYNFARYVHLLPATNTGNHRGAGGLFRMGLELGLYSLQIANSTTFTSTGSISAENRYRNHPKWVFATFVAGLCSEIYRPISNMVVVVDGGAKWPQLISPLHEWLSKNSYPRYYVIWNAQSENELGFQQANAAYLLTAIVPQTCLQYLVDGDTDIMLAMTSCVTGANNGNNQISKIVDIVRYKVIKNDNDSNLEHYGRQIVGSHLEPHLLDAMRRLLKDGSWTVNTKGARIWYTQSEGLFIVWQAAAREILKLLEKDGRQGVPQDADTLADILISCGAAEMTDAGERYWEIKIPVSMQLLGAIRISHPEILLKNSEVLPSDEHLLSGMTIEGADQSSDIDIETGEVLVPIPHQTIEPNPKAEAKEKVTEVPSHTVTSLPDQDKGIVTAQTDAIEQKSVMEPAGNTDDKKSKAKLVKMQASTSPSTAAQKMGSKPKDGHTGGKPSGSAIFKPKPAGVIKEKIVPLGSRAKELFAALKPDIKEHLQAIMDDHIKNQSVGQVFCVAQGMAISTEEMNAHGQVNYTSLLMALSTKKWLWEDEDNFPNGKKLHDIEYAGAMVKVMIIKSDIAREMGFDWKIGAIK